ncbi:MAG: trypsin-like peptidase domain-containing protein [Candidatus Niyogibacteria bacterium]|nr:MAG: trypsin-like peptidase domain-containing protein [Candidatus Niyogibacteria bacterium]
MRKILLMAFILVFLGGFLARAEPYDNNNSLIPDLGSKLEKIIPALARIRTKTVFEQTEDVPPNVSKKIIRILDGRGLAINEGRLLLTLTHVVKHPPSLQVMTPFGPTIIPAKKISEETFIMVGGREYKLDPLYVSADGIVEVALFEIPPFLKVPFFPYSIGNSNKLSLGNFIYIVGDPASSGVNVREGIVSSLTASENQDTARISNGIYPGDSGGPVVAIKDGEFELVGLAQYVLMDPFGRYLSRIGGMLKINAIGREIMDKCAKCSDEIKRFFIPPK